MQTEPEKEYQPYGPEWEKVALGRPKTKLVHLLRNALLERNQLCAATPAPAEAGEAWAVVDDALLSDLEAALAMRPRTLAADGLRLLTAADWLVATMNGFKEADSHAADIAKVWNAAPVLIARIRTAEAAVRLAASPAAPAEARETWVVLRDKLACAVDEWEWDRECILHVDDRERLLETLATWLPGYFHA